MNSTRKQEHYNRVGEQLLVVFGLGKEEYAAPIFQIREVMKLPLIIKIPQSVDFVEGVINIRGRVIPVINLKRRLLIGDDQVVEKSRVMIVELGQQSAGLIVDNVSEVIRINKGDIQSAPRLASEVDNRYIEGVAYYGERMIILLDLNRVFGESEEQEQLQLADGCKTREVYRNEIVDQA